jgi:hypothetical protein
VPTLSEVANTQEVGFLTPVYGTNRVLMDGGTVCQMTGRGTHDCQVQVLSHQPVTLTVQTDPGDSFFAWASFCNGATTTSCTFHTGVQH